jgi:hypothetical protein
VRNVRVIARGTLRALEVGDSVPPQASDAVRELAQATRSFGGWLNATEPPDATREHAKNAAKEAGRVLDSTANLSISVIVGAVRSAAVDLMRATGLERDEALRLVREDP